MPQLPVRNLVMHFEDWGQGQGVVCLPAGAAPGSQWKGLGAALGERYRVLAPDFPGDGRTPRPADLFSSSVLDLETEVTVALIRHVGAPVHVVGHSYGGVQALRVASRLPELVRSVVLLEPVAMDVLVVEGRLGEHPDLVDMTERCGQALQRDDEAEAARAFCGYWLQPVPWEVLPPNNRAAIAGNIRKVYRGWEEIFALPDQRERYAAIPAPTLMVRGDAGPRCARWVTERLGELIPMATLTTIPGAGHMLPMTHPGAVHEAILAHLRAWS
ncbi:MAG: alpha/beta hydrolase [Myxococcota bacterium]